jgi:AhpD family alkylhydroperoxidase
MTLTKPSAPLELSPLDRSAASGREENTPVGVDPDALRHNLARETPELYRTLHNLEARVKRLGLDQRVRQLVKIRASQINGCAYCIDMHTEEARRVGESEQRMHGLAAWREAPYYSVQERAALALTEAMTLLSEDGVPDEVYAEAEARFSAEDLVALIWQVITINSWNRLAVTSKLVPGT